MQYHEFGTANSRTLLFFQGSASHWSWYLESIELLAQNFHVIVPAIDGHEPKEHTNFISIEKTVEDVTQYLIKNGYMELYAVYGLSFGGGMVLRMLTEQRINIQKAIVDAGTAPYQMLYFLTRIVLFRDYWAVRILRSNVHLVKLVFDPKRWTPKGKDEETEYDSLMCFLKSMSKTTLKNVFDSANNYEMPKIIPPMDTLIEFWYGSCEKKSRARDTRYVRRKFPNAVIREIPQMDHGELVIMHPQQFLAQAERFLEGGNCVEHS